MKLLNKIKGKAEKQTNNSKDAAKERLHLVLMQDRANVSADFLELMKQEIIEVIKKYIEIDESAIDVRLTNKENADGTNGAPALYANIPIMNIKDEVRQNSKTNTDNDKVATINEKAITIEEKTEQRIERVIEMVEEKERESQTYANQITEDKEEDIEKEQSKENLEKVENMVGNIVNNNTQEKIEE